METATKKLLKITPVSKAIFSVPQSETLHRRRLQTRINPAILQTLLTCMTRMRRGHAIGLVRSSPAGRCP